MTTTASRSTPTPRPIGFIDHTRTAALQADQTRIQTQAVAQDSLLRFDGGETVALADLLHICLVLGTTGAARRPASSCRRWTV